MASKTPFIYKSFPVFPGAFMVNGNGSFPIFCSIANFQNAGMSDIDNSYIVMPGYKLSVFKDFYTNSQYDIINTDGTTIIYRVATYTNNATSCKLYFKDQEVYVSGIS